VWVAEEDAYYFTNDYAGNQFVGTEITLESGHITMRTCIFPPDASLTEGETRAVQYIEETGIIHNLKPVYLCR